jgi:hypothetical protein
MGRAMVGRAVDEQADLARRPELTRRGSVVIARDQQHRPDHDPAHRGVVMTKRAATGRSVLLATGRPWVVSRSGRRGWRQPTHQRRVVRSELQCKRAGGGHAHYRHGPIKQLPKFLGVVCRQVSHGQARLETRPPANNQHSESGSQRLE